MVVELGGAGLRSCFRCDIEIICPFINLQEKLLNTLEAINMHGLREDLALVVKNLFRKQFTYHGVVDNAPLLVGDDLIEPVEEE